MNSNPQTPTPQMIFLPASPPEICLPCRADNRYHYHETEACYRAQDAAPMIQLWAALNGVQKPVQKPVPVREAYPAPIAYTYEADYHCPGCTAERFGTDEEGWIVEYAEDSEGNRVGAVAPWDEWIEPSEPAPQSLVCGSCFGVIETYTD